MSESASSLGWLLALISLIVLVSLFVKAGVRRLRVPELVVYIMIGMGLKGLDSHWGLLPDQLAYVLRVMGSWGLIVMLFRVGLESDLKGLLAQSRTAFVVWIGDVGGERHGRIRGGPLPAPLFDPYQRHHCYGFNCHQRRSVGSDLAVGRAPAKSNRASADRRRGDGRHHRHRFDGDRVRRPASRSRWN